MATEIDAGNAVETAEAGEHTGGRTLLLIDGHGLVFRAFHAMRQNLATTKGEPTNAVFGFTMMLLAVLERYHPDQIVMTFDTGRTFRHDLSPAYKANRAAMPDELRQQMGRVRQIVEAFNIPIREVRGFEADDVIGSLATKGARGGYQVTVVTGDSDLLQLVGDGIEVVTPGGNNSFSEVRRYDVAAGSMRQPRNPDGDDPNAVTQPPFTDHPRELTPEHRRSTSHVTRPRPKLLHLTRRLRHR